jgi:SAM-dependent methyltransferase
MLNSTQRFSSRVDYYAKYRPHYPAAVLAPLRNECRLTPASWIADIGSGTGRLTELFLENGNLVFAVEPNREMREAGEHLLGHYPALRSVDGTAEATTLRDQSVDFVVTGQAFHWFDRSAAHAEFLRILKPDGLVMIFWNEREMTTTPFLIAYEQLLKEFAPEYSVVDHKKAYRDALAEFYGVHAYETRVFTYLQSLNLQGVQGRLLSSSYTPEAGQANHGPMMRELLKIFQVHQIDGRVEFEYTTRMYYGRLIKNAGFSG